MKKLLIIIILLVTAAVGFYFGYWTNTPAYAAGEIQQAVQKKDLQLFKERVDTVSYTHLTLPTIA